MNEDKDYFMTISLGTHISHCCEIHGCKYGDDDCPVANGLEKQEFPCEMCDEVERNKSIEFKKLEELVHAASVLLSDHSKDLQSPFVKSLVVELARLNLTEVKYGDPHEGY